MQNQTLTVAAVDEITCGREKVNPVALHHPPSERNENIWDSRTALRSSSSGGLCKVTYGTTVENWFNHMWCTDCLPIIHTSTVARVVYCKTGSTPLEWPCHATPIMAIKGWLLLVIPGLTSCARSLVDCGFLSTTRMAGKLNYMECFAWIVKWCPIIADRTVRCCVVNMIIM